MSLRQPRPFKERQWRRFFCRAHISPNDTALLHSWICFEAYFRFEGRVRWQVEHVEAIPRDIEFPTVIDTAQSVFLIAPEKKRRASMGTELVYQSEAAGCIAKCYEPFTEKFHSDGRAVWFWQFSR